jgi:hypothetical protein
MVEQVLGDVAKDHMSGRADQFDGGERNQTIARSDVKEHITWTYECFVKDARPIAFQLGKDRLSQVGVAAVPTFQ